MINRSRRCLSKSSFGVLSLLMVWLSATSTLWGQTPPITDIAFAPDGKSLVSGSQKGLQIFSWPELQLQRTVEASSANLHCLVFSPDGSQLAVGGGNPSEEGIVEIFSWPECQSQRKLSGHTDSVLSVAWKGNLNLVSASLDRSLNLWDLETKKVVTTYLSHSRGVSSTCILSSGEMVTAGHDQSVRVWDSETGDLLRSLNQHSKPVNAMAVCPTSAGLPLVATAAGDRSIRFWQPTIGRMVRYIRLESEPLDIAWIHGTQIVASCVDGRARVIDAEQVQVLETIPAIQGWAYSVALHPWDGTWAMAGSDGQIQRCARTSSQ